jgi:hypothetical protein
MSKHIIDLNTFAEGALAERFNSELQRVLENIADPNTDAAKTRKVTLTVSLKGDNERDVVKTTVIAKSTIVPAKDIESKLMMDYDGEGKVTGGELKSGIKGQTYIDNEGDIADDQGEKVLDFRAQGGRK